MMLLLTRTIRIRLRTDLRVVGRRCCGGLHGVNPQFLISFGALQDKSAGGQTVGGVKALKIE